jgi:endo-1,4-beta-D-glucanase Y
MSAWSTRSQRRILLALLPFLVTASGHCNPVSWPLWETYVSHFIEPQGRVVDHSRGGGITTSEGQSYAMFFALVVNDRAMFDRLLHWTQENLAQGDLKARLPGWLWGKAPDGEWRLLDSGPASDSDAWIAYDLLEAGRLWNNKDYTALGRAMMTHIAQQEVAKLPGFGLMLMPGPTVNFNHGPSYILNASYVPYFIFQRFAAVDPAGPWAAIAANIPRFLNQGARGGFSMDWDTYTQAAGFAPAPGPAPPQPNQPPTPAVGSYDAIRVYLWAGMVDPTVKARASLLAAVPGMAVFVVRRDAPPEKVSDQGIPLPNDGPVGFSAAVLPYLMALPQTGQAAQQQIQRVNSQRDPATGLYGKNPEYNGYYDQNLILFATGFQDKKYAFGPNGELKVQWAH